MLASAFERYMASIATLAIASNPTLSRERKLLDGIALLKHDVQTVTHDAIDILKGPWGARIAAFSRMFGTNDNLIESLSDFERMRKDRNAIAHSFGAQPSHELLSPHAELLVGTRRTANAYGEVKVSERRLVKLFEKVHTAVESIDQQLLSDHIGSFEPAALYLEWEADPGAFEKACGVAVWSDTKTKPRNAKRFLSFALGSGVSQAYVNSLDRYIRQL